MNLVYVILMLVVMLAVFSDSMAILGIVLLFILTLNGCGRSDINCYNKGDKCHDNQDHSVPGPQGDRGPSGPAGPTASRGPSGEKGSKGDAGQNCTVVPVLGGAAVSCPGSETVIVRNGVDGEDGENGEDGSAGTVVASVKFCPNDAPVYPSKFPEVGFCLANKLYAVYSANGGFMTEIPPGTYRSNAVGSSCTFVVLTNCRIQ